MKNLTVQLNDTKILPNVTKTKLVTFILQRKNPWNFQLKLNLAEKDSVPQNQLNILTLKLMKI